MDIRILLLFSWCITLGNADDNCFIRVDLLRKEVYLQCLGDNGYAEPLNRNPCSPGCGIVVENINFFKPSTCRAPGNGYGLSTSETYKNMSTIVAACNGLPICQLNPSYLPALPYNCDSDVVPAESYDIKYYCKPVEFGSNRVFDMGKNFEQKVSADSSGHFLVMKGQGIIHRRKCTVSGENADIDLKILNLNLGSRDNSCGHIQVYGLERQSFLSGWCDENLLPPLLKSLPQSFQNQESFTIVVELVYEGFVWLEISASRSFTIQCDDSRGAWTNNPMDSTPMAISVSLKTTTDLQPGTKVSTLTSKSFTSSTTTRQREAEGEDVDDSGGGESADNDNVGDKEEDVNNNNSSSRSGEENSDDDHGIMKMIIIIVGAVAFVAIIITVFLCWMCVCNWNTPLHRWASTKRRRRRQQRALQQQESQVELQSPHQQEYDYIDSKSAWTQAAGTGQCSMEFMSSIPKGQLVPVHGEFKNATKSVDLDDYTEIPDEPLAPPAPKKPPRSPDVSSPSLQVLPAVHGRSAALKPLVPNKPAGAGSSHTDQQCPTTGSKKSTLPHTSTTLDNPEGNAKLNSLPPLLQLNVAATSECPEFGGNDVTYSVVTKNRNVSKPVVLPEGIYSVTSRSATLPVTATATYHTMDSLTGDYAHLKRPGDEQPVIDNVYDG